MAKRSRRIPLRLHLTPQLKANIEREVQRGPYRDASDYVEAMLWKQLPVPTVNSEDDVNAAIDEAIASGPARPITSRDWARLRRAAERGAARRRAEIKQRKRSA